MGGPREAPDGRDHAAVGEASPRLAEDRFYRVLTSTHRRRLLYYVLENEECTVEELASVLSGWEATKTGTMYTSVDRSAVLLQLRHNHLPRLADAGLIDYDSNVGTVKREPLHPRVTDVIRWSIEAERPDGSG